MGMNDKYSIVENDYDNVEQSFHNTYDTTKEFEDEIRSFASKLPKGARILNIGGTAIECEYFLKLGFTIENLDISQVMLDYIAEHSADTRVIKGNIKDFKSDEPYDAIWACRSLIHIPPKDLQVTLKNIFKLLKNSGFLGAVFFTSELSHIEEQEVPEEHADKE